MNHSTAFGWIDFDLSIAPEWDRAQIHGLARHLGYRLAWPDERSVLRVADQAPDHLSPLELNAVMDVADIETVAPRLSFARWAFAKVGP